MKLNLDTRFAVVATAAVALFLAPGFSGRASAAAFGPYNIANCSGGGATVTLTTITWSPAGSVGGTGCFNTGIGTNLTYSGGVIGPAATGNIKNLGPGTPLPVDQFMTILGTSLDFVLTSLGPGSANTNCAALLVNQSCSVAAGSPFVLTLLAGNQTGVSLAANGTITDAGVLSNWFGAFTTQLNVTPASVQTTILGGGSVASTQSGQFTVEIAAVPEPEAFAMTLMGIAFLGLSRLYKRQS